MPLVSPVTVYIVVFAPLFDMAVHSPLSCLYCQLVMLLLLGLSHCSVTSVGPGWACKPVGLLGVDSAPPSSDAGPAIVSLTARTWKV